MNANRSVFRIIFLLCLSSLFASCSDDDGNQADEFRNDNKNIVTTEPAVARLEFPKLKGGNNIVLVHKTNDKYGINYSLEWDVDKKSQRWSCYEMYQGYQGNAGRYQDGYPFDPGLPDGAYLDGDYFWRSGYDHGHICPSADRQYSKEANKQTFYLTNMQPQRNVFNAGIWQDMENRVRSWTPRNASDTLYVCKGGTIDSENMIIERIKGKLIVPKYFFMALLLKNKYGYRAMAFWIEQKNEDHSDDDLKDYVVSIDELERKTGIDFFCNLPDATENSVESKVALNSWGF